MRVVHVENWFFANRLNQQEFKVVLPDYDDLYVIGEETPGVIHASSRIVEKSDGYVITRSGNRYELGKMHPDYKELIEASKTGTKVITEWSVMKTALLEKVPDLATLTFEDMCDIMLGKGLHKGYMLCGNSGDDYVSGEVVAQSGNHITLRQSNKDCSGVFDEDYLVIWRNYEENMRLNILLGMDKNEEPISSWESNFSFQCRPKLIA